MTTHHDQKVLLSSTLAKAFHGITIDDQNFLLNFHGLFSQERTIQQHFVLSFSDSPTHQELSLLGSQHHHGMTKITESFLTRLLVLIFLPLVPSYDCETRSPSDLAVLLGTRNMNCRQCPARSRTWLLVSTERFASLHWKGKALYLPCDTDNKETHVLGVLDGFSLPSFALVLFPFSLRRQVDYA
jgi:hypothetical protein